MKTPTPKILIKGEGRDEWQNRYFKFAVRGSESDIPPFSAQEILNNPNNLFVALINAGAGAFHRSARTELLVRLGKRKATAAKFRVVTRLGWNSGAFCPSRRNYRPAQETAGAGVPAPKPTAIGEVPGPQALQARGLAAEHR